MWKFIQAILLVSESLGEKATYYWLECSCQIAGVCVCVLGGIHCSVNKFPLTSKVQRFSQKPSFTFLQGVMDSTDLREWTNPDPMIRTSQSWNDNPLEWVKAKVNMWLWILNRIWKYNPLVPNWNTRETCNQQNTRTRSQIRTAGGIKHDRYAPHSILLGFLVKNGDSLFRSDAGGIQSHGTGVNGQR